MGAMVIAGCAERAAEAETTAHTDSAGISIATSPAQDRPLGWTLEPVFVLGGTLEVEADFHDVAADGLATDAAGSLYVLDRSTARILVYDGEGSLSGTIGREGGGPGELGRPSAIAVAPDGTVSVFDHARGGLVRFDPAGEALPEQTVQGHSGGPIHTSDEDLLIVLSALPEGEGVWTERLSWVRRDGSDDDALEAMSFPIRQPVTFESCGMGIWRIQPVFDPTLRWSAHGRMAAVVTGADYEIRIYEGAELSRIVRREIPPAAATDDLAMQELGEGMRITTGGMNRLCEAGEALEKRGHARVIPAIRDLAFDAAGDLWVRRTTPGDGPSPIDLFDPAGEYLGTLEGVAMPAAFPSGNRIAVIEKDEFDLQRITVYQIDRGS